MRPLRDWHVCTLDLRRADKRAAFTALEQMGCVHCTRTIVHARRVASGELVVNKQIG